MTKEDVKIIFVDFDWTIFDHKLHDFDLPSLEALKKAQKQGIKIVLSTARSYQSLVDTKIFDHITFDGMILMNGFAVFYEDKEIKSASIDPEVVRNIIKLANKKHCNLEINGLKSRFLSSRRKNYVKKIYKAFYDTIPSYKEYDGSQVCAILLMGKEKYDQDFISLLPEGYFFQRFFELGADISSYPGDKGAAIKCLLEFLNIDKKYTMSFGDSWLDVSMFKETNYSICLDNAKEETKKEAQVVGASIFDHGVKLVIDELLNQ